MTKLTVSRRGLLIAGAVVVGAALVRPAAAHTTRPAAVGRASLEPKAVPTTPSPTTPAPAPASPILTRAQLTAKLVAYERNRGGTYSVAVYDRHHRQSFSYRPTWRNETLSIIKVLIMATVLRRCQERNVRLTRAQIEQAEAMITRSDNEAAGDLLSWVGVANVRRVARMYGLKDTVIQGGTADGTPGWWGYSTTTAHDQIVLLTGVIWGTTVLTIPNREYLKSLMTQVIPAQRWGVCAPPLPSSSHWNTKNGWGPHSGGYRVNSVGHIAGDGRDYVAVILGRSPHGRDHGRETVSGLSRIVYDALAHSLR